MAHMLLNVHLWQCIARNKWWLNLVAFRALHGCRIAIAQVAVCRLWLLLQELFDHLPIVLRQRLQVRDNEAFRYFQVDFIELCDLINSRNGRIILIR